MSDATATGPDPDPIRGHTVSSYDKDLARLRSLILAMGERTLEQVQTVTTALLGDDLTSAYRVLDREPQIDYLVLDADEEVFQLIARRQPVAADLRIVLGLSRIAAEIERAADKAARIADRTIALHALHGELPAEVRASLRALEQMVGCTFECAMDAVAGFRTATAVKIFDSEESIAGATRELVASLGSLPWLISARERSDSAVIVQQLEPLFAIAHALNRVGNHATAIAEQVIYIAEGQDVRFRNRALLIETLRHRTDGGPT